MPPARPHTPPDLGVPSHRNRDLVAALVGIIGFFLAWGFVVSASAGGPACLGSVNAYTFLIDVLAPLLALTAVYGAHGVIDSCRWIVRPPRPGRSAQQAVAFFQLAAAFTMGFGLIGTLIGLVAMLARLHDPSDMGPRMAVALFSQLCGAFLAILCIATSAFVARRHGQGAGLALLARRSAGIAGVAIVAGTLTTLIAFGIFLLSRAPGL